MVQILISQHYGDIVQTNLVQQGATNRGNNVEIYANKFVVYAKFLETVQSLVRQYNILLLFIYFYPAFLRFGILELRNRNMQNDVTLRVNNSKSKNKKFHFELLTQS